MKVYDRVAGPGTTGGTDAATATLLPGFCTITEAGAKALIFRDDNSGIADLAVAMMEEEKDDAMMLIKGSMTTSSSMFVGWLC